MRPLTIGQVARQAGMGVETVRFYERQGLIAAPARTASGYRHYEEQIVFRLRFIRRAKELGFTLKEIKELLALKLDPSATCADVRRQAETKIADIDAKISSLKKMRDALEKLSRACDGDGDTNECPILDALDSEEKQ